jgi:hypothetical protein
MGFSQNKTQVTARKSPGSRSFGIRTGRVVGDLGQVSALKAPDHPRVAFQGPVYPAPPEVLADGLLVPEPFSASGALSHFQVPFIPK